MYLDVLESKDGRHDWIRTSDIFRVKDHTFLKISHLRTSRLPFRTRRERSGTLFGPELDPENHVGNRYPPERS